MMIMIDPSRKLDSLLTAYCVQFDCKLIAVRSIYILLGKVTSTSIYQRTCPPSSGLG